MPWLLSLILAAVVLFGSTSFHYEVIAYLDKRMRQRKASMRGMVPMAVALIVFAHLVEIGLYAAIFALAAGPLGLGTFKGIQSMGPFDYFYFAAETYSSLGYGDIVPTAGLRLIASIEPLNGLLLLAWSGSFLYAAIHQRRLGE